MILRGNRNQCQSCKEYFNSNAPFEKHRTGKYGGDRRCRTAQEMSELGMVKNAQGFWVTELMNQSIIEKRDALCEQAKTV